SRTRFSVLFAHPATPDVYPLSLHDALPISEVFTALQTNVIDGQENPYAQIASAKFQEVQKYLTITNHVYTPGYVLVSDNHFGKLDRKSTRLNSSHVKISYAVFCLKKKTLPH